MNFEDPPHLDLQEAEQKKLRVADPLETQGQEAEPEQCIPEEPEAAQAESRNLSPLLNLRKSSRHEAEDSGAETPHEWADPAIRLGLPNLIRGLLLISLPIIALVILDIKISEFSFNDIFTDLEIGNWNWSDLSFSLNFLLILVYLPFHLFWTSSALKINRAIGLSKNGAAPFPNHLILALSALLFVLQPFICKISYFGSAYGAINILPATLLFSWFSAELLWPSALICAIFTSRKRFDTTSMLGVLLLGCTSVFALGFAWMSQEWSFFPAIFHHFAWLFFACRILQTPEEEEEISINIENEKAALDSNREVIFEYKPFAAITRWRKQQQHSLKQEFKLVIFTAGTVLLVFLLSGLGMLDYMDRNQWAPIKEPLKISIPKQEDPDKQRKTSALDKYALMSEASLNAQIERNSDLKERLARHYKLTGIRIMNDGQIELFPFGWVDEEQYKELISELVKLRIPAPDQAFGDYVEGQLGFENGKLKLRLNPYSTDAFKRSIQAKTKIDDQDAVLESPKSKQLITVIFLGFTAFLCGLFYKVSRAASHLAVGPLGIRFLWRRLLNNRESDYFEWANLERIYMEKPKNSTSPLDESLCFADRLGAKFTVKMGALESIEDRELLLKAIDKYAADIPRDPSVRLALQAPADYSYTELWLQVLSAPPKRERLKPLNAGTLLKSNRYQVIEQIGVGGQGNAYLCLDGEGEKVVLKESVLPVFVDMNVRRNALEQFENEARLLRQLDHGQIVKLLDFFVEDHRTYLVLEHIDGKSLREIVRENGRLPEAKVVELAKQMAEILTYLHGLNPPVVHRDFTPENLILRKDGTLKLIDFNVAKQIVESSTSGTVVGKHAYLPPEQFRGMPVCASDIYAMGATLHFLLSGSEPLPISVSKPGSLNAELNAALCAIVEKATALDLKVRFASINEMQKELSEL